MGFLKWCSCLRKSPMEDVRVLDFSHSHLVDVPPDVFQYERTLEELHLEANRVTELPRQMFHCQELRVLYVNDNELKSIPPAINSLVNLTKLDLSRNLLCALDDNMKGLKNLRYLDLSMNGLEKLPEVVTSLISLQELYLNDTMMEFLPASFGRLVNLRILELRENPLLTLPKSLSRLTALQRLDIGQNEFSELPEVVGQLTGLVELWVDNNRIRRLPANIGQLQRLVHVDMNNNLLTSLNPEIGEWAQLQELSVSGNDLEALPSTIGQLRQLVALKLDENQLQAIPDSIGQCEQLEELMLSHNDLSELPASLGRLRRLRILTVDENFLRGLPHELSSCAGLAVLSVRGNQLTELPPDIGHLGCLRVINVVNNFLRALPVSLLNLHSLAALWIHDNQSKPLVPLQKEYGSGGAIQLTCYMLPQTAGALKQHQDSAEESRTGGEKRRICFASEVLQRDQRAENGGEETPTTAEESDEGKHSEREDLIAAPPPAVVVTARPQQPRPPHAAHLVGGADAGAVRLMRSPTPYPKDLKMLAKYVRNAGTAGGHRRESAAAEQQQQSRVSQGGVAVDVTPRPHQSLDAHIPHDDTYETLERATPLPMVMLAATQPTTAGSSGNQIREARVATAIPHSHSITHSNNISYSNRVGRETFERSPAIVPGPALADVENNNAGVTPVQPPTGQPPPYHIAKSYTKKTAEDLLIYDSFRNMKNVQLSQPPQTTGSPAFLQRSLVATPTPSITSAATREVRTITEGMTDENLNNLPLPPPPLDLEFYESAGAAPQENGDHGLESDSSLPPPPPVIDEIDAAASNKSSGGVRKSESGQSWMFGLHKNPRVLQYQIPYNGTTTQVGFGVCQLPHQEGIYVSEVSPHSIANHYLRKMDKLLDVDGTDFSRMSLGEATDYFTKNGPPNAAINVMISRR